MITKSIFKDNTVRKCFVSTQSELRVSKADHAKILVTFQGYKV